ncbi:MAG: hypothetical protein ABI954_11250 [Pyrinomonadaceae bacterium]
MPSIAASTPISTTIMPVETTGKVEKEKALRVLRNYKVLIFISITANTLDEVSWGFQKQLADYFRVEN